MLGLLEVCVCWKGEGEVYMGGWFAVHVHLGLSSRPELISVEEGAVSGVREGREGGREKARGQAGQVWVAGHLSR